MGEIPWYPALEHLQKHGRGSCWAFICLVGRVGLFTLDLCFWVVPHVVVQYIRHLLHTHTYTPLVSWGDTGVWIYPG